MAAQQGQEQILAAGVRVSLHNKQDMFGARSKEMLHLTSLLGWFKNSLEAFAIHVLAPILCTRHNKNGMKTQ
jgi:hypothetical protein